MSEAVVVLPHGLELARLGVEEDRPREAVVSQFEQLGLRPLVEHLPLLQDDDQVSEYLKTVHFRYYQDHLLHYIILMHYANHIKV